MIQNEADLRVASHGVDSGRQLIRRHEEVVRETGTSDSGESALHRLAFEPRRIRLALHLVTDAHQGVTAGELPQPRQPILGVPRFEVDPPHHSRNERGLGCELQEFGGLVRGCDRLHDDGGVDRVPRQFRRELVHIERPPENRQVLGPRLIPHAEVPHVVVRVDPQHYSPLPVGAPSV